MHHDKIAREALKACSQALKMVAAFCQHHGPAAGFQAREHVIEDEIVAPLIDGECRIDRRHLQGGVGFEVRR